MFAKLRYLELSNQKIGILEMGYVLYLVLLSMRPKQWVKNIFIFPALFFSKNLFVPETVLTSILTFGIFCLGSGAIYLFNDIIDLEKDKIHPRKAKRPIASGKLSPGVAMIASLFLILISLGAAFFINWLLGLVVLGYFSIQVTYSLSLKDHVILDAFAVASGFFLRVVAGAEAIRVPISSWLLICSIFISLFLALGKRRSELLLLKDGANNHRKVLGEYSLGLLDQMVSIVTAGTVLSYSLYTLSPETIAKFQTEKLWLTIPVVLFGVFRYLYLIYQRNEGGSPEQILLRDRLFLANIGLYVLLVVAVLYW